MDPILVLIVIEQTIATIVIAAAIVVYSRATTRILEAHIEPEVQVNVEGNLENNSLTIANKAGCAISNLNVIISAGCLCGSQLYPVRHCLYFGAWDAMNSGTIEKATDQPIAVNAFRTAQLPSGVEVDQNDIRVEYSFTRQADSRRYSFKYQLGLLRRHQEVPVYVRMEEPTMLSSYKCATSVDTSTQTDCDSGGVTIDAALRLGAATPCIG